MKLEIEIPEAVLLEACKSAVALSLRIPGYNEPAGAGMLVIRDQVSRHFATPDAAAEIAQLVSETARRLAPAIVNQHVTEALNKMVKQAVKEARDTQTLL